MLPHGRKRRDWGRKIRVAERSSTRAEDAFRSGDSYGDSPLAERVAELRTLGAVSAGAGDGYASNCSREP